MPLDKELITLELRKVVIDDTSLLTLLCVCVCVYKVLLIETLLSSRMAKENSQFSRNFTQRYLLTFYRTVFPSYAEKYPGRRRKAIDKQVISGSYHHCQIILSEPLVKSYI